MTNLSADDLRQIERLIDSRAKHTEDQVVTQLRQHFESLTRELGHRLDRLSEQTQSEIRANLEPPQPSSPPPARPGISSLQM